MEEQKENRSAQQEQTQEHETIIIGYTGNSDSIVDDPDPINHPATSSTPIMLTFLVLTWVILGSGCIYALYLWMDTKTLLTHYEQRLEAMESKTNNLQTRRGQKANPAAANGLADAKPEEDEFEVVALQAQILQVDERIATLEKEFIEKVASTEQRNQLLVAIVKLREQVKSQLPFAEQLESVQSLAEGDSTILLQSGLLAQYADHGIKNIDSLRDQFSSMTKSLIMAANMPENETNISDRLKANFHRIVTIRKIGKDMQGDDIDSILARAEQDLKDNKIEKAIIELDKLDGDAEKIANSWLTEARALLESERTFKTIYTYLTNKETAVPATAPESKDQTDTQKETAG